MTKKELIKKMSSIDDNAKIVFEYSVANSGDDFNVKLTAKTPKRKAKLMSSKFNPQSDISFLVNSIDVKR